MRTSITPHFFWITSRAAGFSTLILASLAVSLGLLMSTKLIKGRGPDLLALHEILSLSTLVALVVHGTSLLGDHYLNQSLADIAIPFAGSYKTIWQSMGIVSGWALIALGVSYYCRRRIGTARWRKLHRFTALAWLAGVAHALGEGTDAGQLWFLVMLAIVAIPALALLILRLVSPPRSATPAPARAATPAPPHTPAPARAATPARRRLAPRPLFLQSGRMPSDEPGRAGH